MSGVGRLRRELMPAFRQPDLYPCPENSIGLRSVRRPRQSEDLVAYRLLVFGAVEVIRKVGTLPDQLPAQVQQLASEGWIIDANRADDEVLAGFSVSPEGKAACFIGVYEATHIELPIIAER